jgi:hypothetical protein
MLALCGRDNSICAGSEMCRKGAEGRWVKNAGVSEVDRI